MSFDRASRTSKWEVRGCQEIVPTVPLGLQKLSCEVYGVSAVHFRGQKLCLVPLGGMKSIKITIADIRRGTF